MSHAAQSPAARRWQTTVRRGRTTLGVDSGAEVLWTIVIALDFFWLSNPLVLFTFEGSMRATTGVTLLAVLFTRRRGAAGVPWTVVAMLGLGFLSALWSTSPSVTVDFTLVYFAIAVIALAVAANVDARVVASGFLLGGVLIVVASYYTFEKGFPGTAPLGGGYIAGVGTNRNILAYTLVLSLAFSLGRHPRKRPGRLLWSAGTATVLVGIAMAESATGYLATALLIATAAVLAAIDEWAPPTSERSRRRSSAVLLVASVLAAGAILALNLISRALGRDLTSLSGRVPFWKAIWAETTGSERWFGAGWGTVFNHPWRPPGPNALYDKIVARAGYALPHGHNSVFDLIPELGLLGVAVMTAVYVQSVRRALALRNSIHGPHLRARLEASRVTLLGVIGLVITGLTEPISTVPLGWFAIVLLATGLVPSGMSSGPLKGARARPEVEGVPAWSAIRSV